MLSVQTSMRQEDFSSNDLIVSKVTFIKTEPIESRELQFSSHFKFKSLLSFRIVQAELVYRATTDRSLVVRNVRDKTMRSYVTTFSACLTTTCSTCQTFFSEFCSCPMTSLRSFPKSLSRKSISLVSDLLRLIWPFPSTRNNFSVDPFSPSSWT